MRYLHITVNPNLVKNLLLSVDPGDGPETSDATVVGITKLESLSLTVLPDYRYLSLDLNSQATTISASQVTLTSTCLMHRCHVYNVRNATNDPVSLPTRIRLGSVVPESAWLVACGWKNRNKAVGQTVKGAVLSEVCRRFRFNIVRVTMSATGRTTRPR